MNINKWIKQNTSSLSGKYIAITGSTGGLGIEICNHLASINANLILINRNSAKAESQKQQLLNKFPNIKIDIVYADLSSIKSVKTATEILKNIPMDILILNAGIYCVPKVITDSGYNNIFTTNFVSHYYMVKQLMLNLRKSPDGKVIAVGSIAHNYCELNENDIDYSLSPKNSKIYGNSKRFLMFSLYELFKNEDRVELSIVHPGVTFTNITSHYPKVIYELIKYPMKILFPSPRKASLHIVSGVFNSTTYHNWIGPKVLKVWGRPKLSKLKTCKQS
ncbi:MAG: SDR family NAD(P)-dependent oxidoreductase, partial [Clostridia bacterium]